MKYQPLPATGGTYKARRGGKSVRNRMRPHFRALNVCSQKLNATGFLETRDESRHVVAPSRVSWTKEGRFRD